MSTVDRQKFTSYLTTDEAKAALEWLREQALSIEPKGASATLYEALIAIRGGLATRLDLDGDEK